MPSATAVSEAFQPQAAYNAKLMGLESAQVTWIQHPVSDQAIDTIKARADAAFPQVMEQLTIASSRPMLEDGGADGKTRMGTAPIGPPKATSKL